MGNTTGAATAASSRPTKPYCNMENYREKYHDKKPPLQKGGWGIGNTNRGGNAGSASQRADSISVRPYPIGFGKEKSQTLNWIWLEEAATYSPTGEPQYHRR